MIGARILGDLGADVLKIEPPGGSPSRITPFYKDVADPQKSLFWFAYNTNKRGITLNINKFDGEALFKKLVKTSDIVMESFPPGYMEKLGLAYNDLVKINPKLIMTSISLFGQTGPKAHYKGSDLTAWASGGFLYMCGNKDRAPTWISFPQALLYGGAEAAVGTMTALWHRQMTGEGQQVDVSIQECVISPTLTALQTWDINKINPGRTGGSTLIAATGVRQPFCYKCKDGYVLIMVQGGNEPFVSSSGRLVAWMDEERMAVDWLKKVNWAVDYEATKLQQDLADKVGAEVEKFTLTKTKAELVEEGAIRRHILLAPLNNTRDICDDIQLKSRNYWVEVAHPELGDILTYPGPFIKFSETPITYGRRAPLIGEHNEVIYKEEMGLTSKKLALLKRQRII